MKHIFLLFLFAVSLSAADQAEYLFKQGVEAYQQKDYAAAIRHMEAALQHGQSSASLYYNLGNAYYKTGQIGRSILNYERAKKMAPSDEDIEFNLQIAQLSVVDKIPSPEQDFFFKLWNGVKNVLSLEQYALLTIGLYILFIVLIVLKLLIKKKALLRLAQLTWLPVLVLLLLVGSMFVVRVQQDIKIKHGVILVDKVSVVSSPAADSTEMFALHEGVKIQIIAQSGDFLRVRLTDGKDGWVQADALEII